MASFLEGMTQEQLAKLTAGWFDFIESIAHDMRTPLLSIGLFNNAIAEMLPSFVKGYQLAVEHRLMEPAIASRRLKLLEQSGFDSTQDDVNRLMDFLKKSSDLAKALSDTSTIKSFSYKVCLNDLLEKYPFKNNEEGALVHVDIERDFKFRYYSAFVHRLFDVLLCVILHQAGPKKGDIYITNAEKEGYHLVYFKCTVGIDKNTLTTLMTQFFFKEGEAENEKLVPGLGFCKLALLQLNGDLIVNSEKGECVGFVVKFPKISS